MKAVKEFKLNRIAKMYNRVCKSCSEGIPEGDSIPDKVRILASYAIYISNHKIDCNIMDEVCSKFLDVDINSLALPKNLFGSKKEAIPNDIFLEYIGKIMFDRINPKLMKEACQIMSKQQPPNIISEKHQLEEAKETSPPFAPHLLISFPNLSNSS
jgi:hypothetical protein